MRQVACRLVVPLALLVSGPGCASMQAPWANWTALRFSEVQPGTPEWWARNRSRAEFVPGEGYRVDGVPGYFDEKGRPTHTVAPVSFEEQPEGLAASLDPKLAYDKVKNAIGQGPDQQLAQQRFAEGEAHYRAGKYGDAAESFHEATTRAVSPSLHQDALFLHAESLFFADKYPAANDAYGMLIEQYPSSKYLDKAVARKSAIARYWHESHQHDPAWPIVPNLLDGTKPRFDILGHALKTYDSIRMNDPTGPLADDALMATANAHFVRGRWDDADYHYGLLRREYPKSEHQLNAHLLGLQSKLRMYKGPDYDAAPLDEAKELIKQLRIQFGVELPAEERERLREIEAQIAQHRAFRDWQTASFYDKREFYRAAKYYYVEVARKYPSTELAQRARDRINELDGEPDVPPEKLGWLMRMFPQNRDRAAIALAKGESRIR